MTEYRCITTDLVTGTVRADNLPLRVESFGRTLGDAADLTATLDLRTASTITTSYINALEPRRTALWVAQDSTLIWGGIIWDQPHRSVLDNTLPIRASTIESLFAHREVRDDQVFTAADSLDIFRSLLSYATTGAYRTVAGLTAATTPAGDSQTITFPATDRKKILDCWKDIAASADIEFTFDPVLDAAGSPGWTARFGVPTAGVDAATVGLVLQFPGNVADYAWPRIGSGSANSIRATASASSADGSTADWRSAATHGVDSSDLAAGAPMLEDTVAYTGATITAQTQVDAYADTIVAARTRNTTTPTVILGGPAAPRVSDLTLGSYVWLLATSPLHPADPATAAPGLQRMVRIVGWTVTPATGDQAEQITLQLGEVDAT